MIKLFEKGGFVVDVWGFFDFPPIERFAWKTSISKSNNDIEFTTKAK